MAKKTEQKEETQLNRLEKFIYTYQKPISYAILGILVIVGLYIGWNKFILADREKKAEEEIFQAQIYFEQDSLDLALNGDVNHLGFIDIADNYSWTETGNLASYYAGIILLKKGEYEKAIDYLEDFNTDSRVLGPLSLGALGDAYSQLKEYGKAANYYKKAARENKNNFTAPYYYKKAGLVLEKLEDYKDALKMFKMLKEDYPESLEAKDVVKYISRVKARMAVSES